MLKLTLLCLHDCVLLSQNIISINFLALLVKLVLFFHLRLHLSLLDLLHEICLKSIVVILALKGLTLKRVADFEIFPLLIILYQRRNKLILSLLILGEIHQFALVVLISDCFLPRDAIFHSLHVIILVFHER